MLISKTIFGPVMLAAELKRVLTLSANSAQNQRSVTRHANLLLSFPKVPIFNDEFSAFSTRDFSIFSLPLLIMQRAKSSCAGSIFAFLTFLWHSPAFKAHLLSSLRCVSFKNVLSALKTVCSVVFTLPKLLIVVVAHSPSNGRFFTKLAGSFGMMNLLVMPAPSPSKTC